MKSQRSYNLSWGEYEGLYQILCQSICWETAQQTADADAVWNYSE